MLLLALLAACTGDKGIDITGTPPGGGDSGDPGTSTSTTPTVPAAALAVSPETVDVGTVVLGNSGIASIDVANIGDAAAVLELSVSGSTDWTVALDSTIVEAGGVVSGTVTLAPSAFGTIEAVLTLLDTSGGATIDVPLTGIGVEDLDGDGYGSVESGGDDCNDVDPAIHPGAEDTWYDGLDTDCGGNNDYDQDGDGIPRDGDCDDENAAAFPGADDAWYDGVDTDCAGNDDYDQDADGHVPREYALLPTLGVDGSGMLPADDCDDTNAAIYGGAEDAWYDGVDTDCAGNDDYDQDADGHQSLDYGGDDCDDLAANVYPGAAETWYDGLDGDCAGGDDYDQDGDGVDYPSDCNDTDPAITGPTAETLNGNDDDCNGLIDDLPVDSFSTTVIYGDADSQALGDAGTLALGGDLTGDGTPDIALLSDSGSSYAWVVSGGMVGTADTVTAMATATVTGSSSHPFGRVVGPLGDATGDATADLLVGGFYERYADGDARMYFGGATLSGAISYTDEDAQFQGDSDGDMLKIAVIADIDGDGVNDVATGAPYDNYSNGGWSSESYTGNVSFFSGPFAGTVDLGDSEDQIHGADNYDYLGDELSYGDLDGDGYTDVLAGAPGHDDGRTTDAGGVYIFAGNASIAWADDQADAAASYIVTGSSSRTELGDAPLSVPGDQDGDGALDLAIGAGNLDTVWLWWDGSTLSGTSDVSSADAVFTGAGNFGGAVGAASDTDGDGKDELVVGASGDDTNGTDAGAAYVFGGGGWSGAIATSSATATIYGVSTGDAFGAGLGSGADLDADGKEDLLVGATGVDQGVTDGGAVYVILGW